MELGRLLEQVENVMGMPVEIEWALDDAGLKFVDDQHDAMFVTDLAQAIEENLRRRHVATLALDHLNHNAGDFFGRGSRFE